VKKDSSIKKAASKYIEDKWDFWEEDEDMDEISTK
jgi:hypothetical protein